MSKQQSIKESKFEFNYDPIKNPAPTGLNGVSKSPKALFRTNEIEEANFLILLMSIKNDGLPKPKLENVLRDMPDIILWMMRLIISENHYHENKGTNTSEALEAMATLTKFLWSESKSSKIFSAKLKIATAKYDDGKRTDEEAALLREVKS